MTADKAPKPRQRQERLNENQRYLIEDLWNNQRMTQSDIGRRLGYSASVISRELKRGNLLDFSHIERRELLSLSPHARIKYSAQRGQFLAVKKRFRMGQGLLLTPEMKALIEHWVNDEHWTPEQIAGNIKDVDVSASTIRLWSKRGLLQIRTHKYHRRDGSDKERSVAQTQRAREKELARLRDKLKQDGELVRHSIYDRSKVIESRKQFGHWEMDLVQPKKTNGSEHPDKSAIMTLIERQTRYYVLVKVKSKSADDMIEAFKYFWTNYGKAVRSVTADNGSEFISWAFLEYVQRELKTKIYYCTPSSPQQRGSNENRNGKLRDWFPKGTSFRNVKQADLDVVMMKMNNLPLLKALSGKRAIDEFDKAYKTMQRYRRAYEKRKQKQAEKALEQAEKRQNNDK
ncbi:IS30 family transposase [Leuconostoc citreum]|uniref:IS30 family transposase n=1 Tax=Leuconostoc citreum TaxID=33964 RepID=UPI00200ADC13|nr:IS30 family transposase [Leuconostoc citreum]MCK8605660.1 IS30 family transposase [Leuconostoc citreum]